MAERLGARRSADGLRRLSEVRVLGLDVEEDVLRDLAAEDEAGAADQQVLLEAAGVVVRRVADLLEVRLRLQEDAELEVDVVVDLDDGLGFGPAEREQEQGGDETTGGRPQGAVREIGMRAFLLFGRTCWRD